MRFDGGQPVENFEVLFGVYNLNYFIQFFLGIWVRGGCFFPGSSLNGQFNWLSACKGRTAEEVRYCDVDLMQPRVFCLYDILGRLETY